MKRKESISFSAVGVVAGLCLAGAALAASPARVPANPLRNAYFGQLHLHTAMSFDAYLFGTRLYPEDAYRYARGETIEFQGRKLHLSGPPLDFLGVSDHAEYLGQMSVAGQAAGPLEDTEFAAATKAPLQKRFGVMMGLADSFGSGGVQQPMLLQEKLMKSSWQRQIDAANRFYEPGKFTTFVAYEYSSIPNGANLHRNVIFRGPKYPELPFSSLDSPNPEDLWRYLAHQRLLGIEAIAIPHNSNVSDGLMWSYADFERRPIDKEYAETRVSLERLAEITQTKGTSETRPELSPNDDFAGFELINNLLTVPRPSSINGSYIRQAYARGLEIGQRTGVDPYEFGLIGGSDYHNALASTSPREIPGQLELSADVKKVLTDATSLAGVQVSNAALAGVWAESNTRESIFDALYRRETFATSGTRIRVRFFAGFRYPQDAIKRHDWVRQAYARGVPMGADLYGPVARESGAPLRFLVQAVKDPDGANLDRVQIVKVWTQNGAEKEKIYDVAWAGSRHVGADGKLAPIGSTVDTQRATYSNTIGSVELATEWQDPDFHPDVPAVYYARVLEIPTPRWTTYVAVANKMPLPTSVPASIQQRAWTSPVFYHPATLSP